MGRSIDVLLSIRAGVRRPRPGGRRALGLFAIVWVNLALQPCAMALEGDGGCPNCPPEIDRNGTPRHGVAHDHHRATSGIPCATGGFDCELLDEYSHDGRGGQIKLKNAPDNAPATAIETNTFRPVIRPAATREFNCPTSVLPPGSPSLNILFCVHLK